MSSVAVEVGTAWAIIQSIQILSLDLSFQLPIQSQYDILRTYSFSDMLHSLSSFPFR